ncbi:cyclic nucleotide-binding domain-containing protein [Nevskia soli]|uniref:cyclic nucleotide-binding domain-containing protein n=1 Tax=Nevskia soli TaxID=418856 RepID=UPI0004A6EA70|nr:cyclic nucleotide-binding domain-containing protein [Nevskia soli]
MGESFKIAVIGSGPAGLSAAARAAELGLSHVLLEAEAHLSNTIYRYQKGKYVMAEPAILPLRSPVSFAAGKREQILETWNRESDGLKVNRRLRSEVTGVSGTRGAFCLKLADDSVIRAEHVVLAIGLQGNIRKLGCPGEDAAFVQYQLDDPDEYNDETIVVIGAGDAAIENAMALCERNKVIVVNRRDEFDRAKAANNAAILKAIADGRIQCFYNSGPRKAEDQPGRRPRGLIILNTASGEVHLPCDRVIARLGATPPRKFVEGCGVAFPTADVTSLPAVSATYESNVAGLYIIGALAGFPLIKQAMNQGYEVVEFIQGHNVEPADEPLLRGKFGAMPGFRTVDAALELVQRRVPVLAPLTRLQLREFLLDSELRLPQQGEVIFERNAYSDSFYSIVNGQVDIELVGGKATRTVTLGPGEFFGEMSLISGRRRSATVHAGPNCMLVETPRRSMNKLIYSIPAVKRVLDQSFLSRAIQAAIAPERPPVALQSLIATASVLAFKPGEHLFREGEPGDCLHLIRKGSVTISRHMDGRDVVLAYVPAGQYVGEMALVSNIPRSATVTAAVATETIRIDGEAFKAMLAQDPPVKARVEEIYKNRLARNVSALQQPERGGVIGFLMAQGVGEATDVLLIDESLCVRCDQCEKACTDTHGGLSRLNREAGPTFENLHVPTSCRHCEHPHCMKDCPPDAIKRAPNGEVFISDACIGCGNCQRNCPYGVIQMGVESKTRPSLWRWMLFGGREPGLQDHAHHDHGDVPKKAAKCDMCKSLPGGPACVRACPTGAARRVSPEQFLRVARKE